MIKSIMQGILVLALAASPALANESYESSSSGGASSSQWPSTPEPAMSASELDAIFDEADRDKDGALSQDEFDEAATLLGESPDSMPSS